MLNFNQFEALVIAGETVARDRQERGAVGPIDFSNPIDSILVARSLEQIGLKPTAHKDQSVLGYFVRQAVEQGFFDSM